MWVLILQKEKGGACSGNAIVEEDARLAGKGTGFSHDNAGAIPTSFFQPSRPPFPVSLTTFTSNEKMANHFTKRRIPTRIKIFFRILT